MHPYIFDNFDSPADTRELLLLDIVYKLWMAQAEHRFHDPNAPRPSEFTKGARGLDEVKAATEAWRDARRRYYEKHGPPTPKPQASLEYLWDRIEVTDRPQPIRSAGEDLFFETFALSHRFVDEPCSPSGRWSRSYFVGFPTTSESFRCVAIDGSCRRFMTVNQLSRCEPPAMEDFQAVSVSAIQVNFVTGESRPTVMELYLPSFGPWQMINHERCEHEKIVP